MIFLRFAKTIIQLIKSIFIYLNFSLVFFMMMILIQTKANKIVQPIDDKKSLQYGEFMSKVRDGHGTIYSACMNYLIKAPPTKADDEIILRAVKGLNHGYVVKLLLDDAKSANWDCTFGLWLLFAVILLITGLIGGVIFKLISKYCRTSSIKCQSCIKF